MKKIYFVLSYTGSMLSKAVRAYTKKEYSHISISLDMDLDHMYSFGRLFPYISIIGGFVQEYKDAGTFKRFKNSRALVFSTEITDEQYESLKENIKSFENNKRKYTFNLLGLAMVPLNIQIKRKHAFYCAEFVKFVLDESKIPNNLPTIVKPLDFLEMDNIQPIYEGKISEYKGSKVITV